MKFNEWQAEQRAAASQETKSEEEIAEWVNEVNEWMENHGVMNFVVGPAHHKTWGHLKAAVAGFEIYRDEFILD